MTQRIKVANDRSCYVTLWLEPWGEDYGMAPGDEFDVVATNEEAAFYFHISHSEEGMKVYAEGDAERVSVYRAGDILSCGHNRNRNRNKAREL